MKKKTISIFALVMLLVNIFSMSITKVSADESQNDMLIWYKFDETSGTIANDSSGHGNNGTLVGGATWTTGKKDGAVNLDGSSGYVKIPNSILNGLNNITITAFVKMPETSGSRWIFGLGTDNNKYIFVTPQTNNGKYRGAITTGTYRTEQGVENGSPLPANVWKHVALVISGDTHTETLYADGVQVAQNTNITLKPSDVYDASKDVSGYIGKSFYSADPMIKGQVDDFRIYNRALSADEIQTMGLTPTDITNVALPQLKTTAPIIDNTNYKITLPVQPGTDVTKLAPTFTLTTSSSIIAPASGSEQDFTNPVNYTVKAQDGSTVNWSVEAKVYGNPVLPGLYADPNVAVFGDTYYIYPTTDGYPGWGGTYFKAFSSKDLVNWKDEGKILDLPTDVPWGPSRAWAPTIAERNGTYYFYFCANGNIGVATSNSPAGPFKDALGKPLVASGAYSGQMIDPQTFVDDDGQAYLYFGNGSLYVAKLNDDMISLKTTPQNITPSNFREGVFTFKRAGKYYLTWSEDDTGSENYSVAYAMSDSPIGPFTKIGTILSKDLSLGIKATGHQSVLKIPNKDEYYMVYHRFAMPNGDGTHRETCIDKMEFNADGTIKTIKPTLEGITVPNTITNTTTQLTEIAPVNVSTKVGVAPVLPATVQTVYSDKSAKISNVKWDAVDLGKYAAAGKFIVEGTVDGTSIKAQATVTVVDTQEGMTAWYKFNEASGTTVIDQSGHNNNATLVGGASWTSEIGDGAVKLDGKSGYVKLPNSILNGANNITITALVRRDDTTNNEWIFGLGPDNNKYIFVTPSNDSGRYHGAITTGTYSSEQVAEKSSALASGTWKNIVLVISGDTHTETLYEDGVQVAQNTNLTLKPSDVYDATKDYSGYIGKSLYPDPLFNGEIADFRIYNKALSADDITADNTQVQADIDGASVYTDKSNISLGDINSVVGNLTLPKSGSCGSTVSWQSSNETVIKADGTVSRPSEGVGNTTVTLTATVKKGAAQDTKNFAVTVLQKSSSQDLNLDKQNVDLGPTTVVTSNLVLPTSGKYGSSIAWQSSDESTIKANGEVTRPAVGAGNKEVTLTATIKNGSLQDTKQFTVTVLEQYTAYVMGYFNGGSTETNNSEVDSLFLAYSYDGLHWNNLNGGKAVLNATMGTTHIRDPFVFRKQDGKFGVVATNNWSSPQIFVWDSDNLIDYKNERLLTMNNTNAHAWAPEIIYDPVSKKYVVYWAGDVIYSNTVSDNNFTAVSDATKYFDPGYGCLDSDITQWNGKYYMAFKRGYKAIQMAEASSLNPGSFKLMQPEYITSLVNDNEGPVIIKSLTENKWYLYYDYFGLGRYGCSYTTDLEGNNWTELDSSQFSVPKGMRHSNAVGVTKAELDALIAKWGSASDVLAAPTGIKAEASGTDKINLSWTSVTGATGYNVYRSTTVDGNYTKVNTALVTTNSYVDGDLKADTAYYYKVTAANAVRESVMSDNVTATTGKNSGSSNDFTIKSTFNLDNLQSNKMLDVKTTVTNNNGSQQSVLAIVALYDGNDKMVNMSYISKSIPVGGTENLSSGFKLPTDITNYKVKVFVWEGTSVISSSMQPLSNLVTLP